MTALNLKRRYVHLLSLDCDGGGMSLLSCVMEGSRLRPSGTVREVSSLPDGGELHVSLISRRAGVLRAALPRMKRDVMRLQIEDRLRQEIYPGQEVDFTYRHIQGKGVGDGVSLTLVAMETAPVARVLSWAVRRPRLRLRSVVPESVAVAGLMARLTAKPVLILAVREGWMEVSAVEGGVPLYRQAVPLPEGALADGLIDWSGVDRSFMVALQTALRRGPEEIHGFVVIGGDGLETPEEIAGVKRWVPPLQRVVLAGEPISYLDSCHLLGAPFIRRELNFLPKSFEIAYSWRKACNIAASILMAGAVGLSGWTWRLSAMDRAAEREYRSLKGEVAAKASSISERLPRGREESLLRRFISIYEQERRAPRPSRILLNIASLLPGDVQIAGFVMERNRGEGSSSASGAASPRSASAAPVFQGGGPRAAASGGGGEAALKVSVTFESRGDFFEVKRRFQGLSDGLRRRFSVKELKWTYDRKKKMGELRCSLEVDSARGVEL